MSVKKLPLSAFDLIIFIFFPIFSLIQIPFALIEPLLEMMAAIDWDNISDWIQVGLEIDQLFKKEWGEGENLEVKKKMKNQIIGELRSSPQTLIKDLSKQANSKSASAKLQYGLSIRSGSGILSMKFEGHDAHS